MGIRKGEGVASIFRASRSAIQRSTIHSWERERGDDRRTAKGEPNSDGKARKAAERGSSTRGGSAVRRSESSRGPACRARLSTRTPTSIEDEKTRLTLVCSSTRSPTVDGCLKMSASTLATTGSTASPSDAVCCAATMHAASTIHAITCPPNVLPWWLAWCGSTSCVVCSCASGRGRERASSRGREKSAHSSGSTPEPA
eukprot:6184603-Pleurochrysis_carterae.AAC.1